MPEFAPVNLGNILTQAEGIKGARARNSLYGAQERRMNALAGQEQTRFDQQNTVFDQGQQDRIRQQLAQRFSAIASSSSPRQAASMYLGTPEFQESGRALGLPVEQFVIDDTDTDDSVRQQAMDAARMLGGQASAPERKILKDAAGRQRYADDGSYVFDDVDMSGQVTPRERFELDQSEHNLQRAVEDRQRTRLSAGLERELLEAQDRSFQSTGQAQELLVLADEYDRNPEMIAGSAGNAWEGIKTALGQEDAVSLLRRRYAAVRNSLVIQNLPPGVASDRDIQIAMEGFLPPTANPQQVASFLRGMGKMEQLNAEYNEFKANYISENRKADGLLPAWKSHLDQKRDAAPVQQPTSQPEMTATGPNGERIVLRNGQWVPLDAQ